jgi:hypothetical protein
MRVQPGERATIRRVPVRPLPGHTLSTATVQPRFRVTRRLNGAASHFRWAGTPGTTDAVEEADRGSAEEVSVFLGC